MDEKEKASKRGKASRAKGAFYENKIRNWLIAEGFDVFNPAAGGSEGADILVVDNNLQPFRGEAKNHNTPSYGAFIDQATGQAGASGLGYVVSHRRGNGNPAKDFVILRLEDFVVILNALKEGTTIKSELAERQKEK